MTEEFGVRDELTRKSLDFLIDTAHRLETSRITPEEAVVRARTVWNITSGLVESEVSDLAQRLVDETNHKIGSRSLYFHHPDGSFARLRYPLDAPGLSLLLRTPKLPFREPSNVEVSMEDRPERLKTMITRLINEGYKPV